MRILVTTTQIPLVRGGAEVLADGLVGALRAAGHSVELVTMPFRFAPPSEVRRSMDAWAQEDFNTLDCGEIDAVVCLKFPTYYLHHPRRMVWLLHQHRVAYELFGTPYDGGLARRAEGDELRREIVARDTEALSSATRLFAISANVVDRLERFNGIRATPLYHPPANADRFYSGEALPFVFYPSRLETLKRQELLIRALPLLRSPVAVVLAGEGGLWPHLSGLVEELGVSSRVRLVGRLAHDEMLAYFASCLAVFFGPYDEDYGYVTLEAMLAEKPVITCTDSGGPLEFVRHEHTGLVVNPTPEAVARAIDELYADRRRSVEMGIEGRRRYDELDLTWTNVANTLLQGVGA